MSDGIEFVFNRRNHRGQRSTRSVRMTNRDGVIPSETARPARTEGSRRAICLKPTFTESFDCAGDDELNVHSRISSTPSSLIPPPIFPRLRVPANRAPACERRSACNRAQSTPAPLRSPVPAPASAHAPRSPLPRPPLRRPGLSTPAPFAPLFSFPHRLSSKVTRHHCLPPPL